MKRGSDLGDNLGTQFFPCLIEGFLELAQATRSKLQVGRPGGLVEGPTGGGNSPFHIFGRGIRDLADDLLGGGVHIGVGSAALGFDQFAVDQHSGFGQGGKIGHGGLHPGVGATWKG